MNGSKVAIVTGAASGIGQGTAVRLARSGVKVVCADVNDAADTRRLIESEGGRCEVHELDVRSSQQWTALVTKVSATLGTPTLLANVAGVVSTGPDNPLDQTEEEWGRIVDINLKGTWLGIKATLPGMLAAGDGRIVNIASEAALIGIPGLLAYTATKGGVAAMTRAIAVEYASTGVTVNAVAPGFIKTPIQDGLEQEALDAMIAGIPARRIGAPADIAGAIHYLMSDEASYVTGQVLAVDGGWGVS